MRRWWRPQAFRRPEEGTQVLAAHGGVVESDAGITSRRERPVHCASDPERRPSALRVLGEDRAREGAGRSAVVGPVAGGPSRRCGSLVCAVLFAGVMRRVPWCAG